MNVAYPFHPRYLMLYTGYRPLADYLRKSCISIYHPPPTNVNDDSTLMCPLNDGIFYLSESATHQEEYFLKHDHYYDTVKACFSMYVPIDNLLKIYYYWRDMSLSIYRPCFNDVP